jgi:hypothetical protein
MVAPVINSTRDERSEPPRMGENDRHCLETPSTALEGSSMPLDLNSSVPTEQQKSESPGISQTEPLDESIKEKEELKDAESEPCRTSQLGGPNTSPEKHEHHPIPSRSASNRNLRKRKSRVVEDVEPDVSPPKNRRLSIRQNRLVAAESVSMAKKAPKEIVSSSCQGATPINSKPVKVVYRLGIKI